jgi:hypothetical protein
VKQTLSGKIDLNMVGIKPGIFLCGTATPNAGHILRCDTNYNVFVYDSYGFKYEPYVTANTNYIVRWQFILQLHIGFF